MPRTAILYARSERRDELDRQVRELEDWCDRAGAVLADVAAGRADLVLIRDISRLSENTDQLHELINEHRHRIAISRDDLGPTR